MLALVPVLLLLPSVLGGVVPPPLLVDREELAVSPNKTCGGTAGYTCPSSDACCSKYGYCGSGDEFCLTTTGCQSKFSNSTSSCKEPKAGTTVSVDGTCGTTGAGSAGYVCPSTGPETCCSASGYCGNTTGHCDASEGCQSKYGKCNGAKSRARSLFPINPFAV